MKLIRRALLALSLALVVSAAAPSAAATADVAGGPSGPVCGTCW